jgi:hypothetical protein
MRWLGRFIPLWSSVMLAGLSGCTTPQYQTAYRYEPPADAQGRACVQRCDVTKIACQTDCQARYKACQKDVAPLIEERYLQALKDYELDLKCYAAFLRHHEIQYYNSWPFSPWNDHPGYSSPWPPPCAYPPPYPVPAMPTREGVRIALQEEKYRDDCGCLPAFDSCFVDCGGKRIAEAICAKNCPKQK